MKNASSWNLTLGEHSRVSCGTKAGACAYIAASRCEAMVFDTEGRPLQGITGGSVNERRVEFILKERRYSQTFYIEVSANGRFGRHCLNAG